MSSYEKVVKLACKPKAAPPKAKYLDPIIAATWSDDGAVHDVCKALSPRLREPNSVVVFKALIVLHMMIRNGSTDNVLSYLSSSDVLRLRNVTDAPWEGYAAPENLKSYAMYMETRIKAYANLRHDAIRVQSESNRDHRASGEDGFGGRRARGGGSGGGGISRSKTIAGRKLRQMTVEKGLLRETKIVQRMVTSLLSCKFYLDNLEDELVVSALQLLVKDLLVLFQAVNEGVINVLEHYFEMSHVDATTALEIYRHFCAQTKEVVEYLSVAKKLQNILGIPIPNLKHAPVSLAGSLQEYLNDPNFEQNRIEYRTNKAIADGKPPPKESKAASMNGAQSSSNVPPLPKAGEGSKTKAEASTANAVTDFFTSIEQEQSSMFNPQTNSPSISYFQQQAASNPFSQGQAGIPMGVNQFGQQIPTGPFAGLQPQPTGAPYLQPQPTGFLQPQTTGFNPFRQSVLMPQMAGFTPFTLAPTGALGNPAQQSNSPFSSTQPPFPIPPFSSTSQSASSSTFPFNATNANTNASIAPSIQRPQSTPILSQADETLKPVVSHQTGSRNPFGIPRAASPPPLPKMPTLQELTSGAFNKPGTSNYSALQPGPMPRSSSPTAQSPNVSSTGMGSIASMFTGIHRNGTNSPPPVNNPISSLFPGHATNSSSISTGSFNTIQPQPTGFAGIAPFQPSSSFGASLLDALPSITGASGSTDLPGRSMSPPGQHNLPPSANAGISTPFGSINSKSTLASISEAEPTTGFLQPSAGNNQLTASNTLRPLAPQLTGTPNPFRASMMDPSSPLASLQSQPTGFGASPFGKSTVAPFQPQSSFGQQAFAAASTGPGSSAGAQNTPNGQQTQSNNPLISFT